MEQDFAWSQIEGLEHLQMFSMDVDAEGTLWLGLSDGVASYDGREVVQYGAGEGSTGGESISVLATKSGGVYFFQRQGIDYLKDGSWHTISDMVVNIQSMEIAIEAADGTVWAAVRGGILQINGEKTLLHRQSLHAHMGCVLEDQIGNIWSVALDDGRTYRIPVEEGLLAPADRWEVMLETTASQSSRYGLLQDGDGKIWRFSTDPADPTRYFDPRTGVWTEEDFKAFGGSNQVQEQFITSDGILWAISDGVMHGRQDGQWSIHRKLASRHGPMRATMAESSTGDLWVLGYRINLYRIDYSGRRWRSYDDLLYQFDGPEDERWFISEAGKVIRKSGSADFEWVAYGTEDGLIEHVAGLFRWSDGGIWAVGGDGGVAALSKFDGESWTSKRYPVFGDSFRGDSFLEVGPDEVLGCSWNYQNWLVREVGGVIRLDRQGNLKDGGVVASSELPSRIVSVEKGPDGGIWANAGFELLKYSGNTWIPQSIFQEIQLDDIALDGAGNVWGANWGFGVAKQGGDESLGSVAENRGLGSRLVSRLLIGEKKRALFALSSEGINRFDGSRWYLIAGETQMTNHRDASFLKEGVDGSLWVIQANMPWLERMHPDHEYKSPVGEAFRSLEYRMDRNPPETYVEVVHKPDSMDRGLSVRWAAKDVWGETMQRDLRFSYRLDGGAWSEYMAEPERSFHQLDDGQHLLEVRARDADFNVDETPASFAFSIPPPLWRQTWFVVLVVLVFGLILLLLGVIFRQRWRYLIEHDRQRIHFFTNISHELRTPLALILAPLEKAASVTRNESVKTDLSLAMKSARRLNQLVDQLLDFRKIESGAMESDRVDGDLVAQMEEITHAFEPLAETKEQSIDFKCLEDSKIVSYDQDKLQKVIANLISNGLKYTGRGGRVKVTLEFLGKKLGERLRERAVISVEDNGRGISPSRQKHIFEPFYRGNSKASREATGTGLGLSLTQQLVGLMDGKIQVVSPVREGAGERAGTRFTVTLPVYDVSGDESKSPEGDGGEESFDAGPNETLKDGSVGRGQGLRILLVEDNEDLRAFVTRELAERFEVFSAENGKEGLALAREKVPDLVIADVMMPEMNGIDFCRELKSHLTTSHIPVIMLTARSSSSFEKLGLESGADEYLTKPISMVTLELRIRNLLETRAKLQERLRSQFLSEPTEPAIENKEQAFIKRIVDCLEGHLADPNFGVDELAETMGQSRSSFYRKLKAISDETPQGFIRSYRMKRAEQLLIGSTLSITEIMYEVGYQDLGYFGKVFKSHFKCSPTEYKQKKAG